MAKITIAGQAVVITSELKLEDIKKVKKYRPDALILRGGEDGKEPIFALGIGDSSINKFGVSFCQETRDDEKHAVLTMTTTYDGDDIKEFVADELGSSIINLEKLESKLPEIIEEINAERDSVKASISVAQ